MALFQRQQYRHIQARGSQVLFKLINPQPSLFSRLLCQNRYYPPLSSPSPAEAALLQRPAAIIKSILAQSLTTLQPQVLYCAAIWLQRTLQNSRIKKGRKTCAGTKPAGCETGYKE
jgi:hypothetical protein